ncbi:MAG TPA: hypothetical protein VGM93_15525, partial [Acidimicrobiales bacterium]
MVQPRCAAATGQRGRPSRPIEAAQGPGAPGSTGGATHPASPVDTTGHGPRRPGIAPFSDARFDRAYLRLAGPRRRPLARPPGPDRGRSADGPRHP